MWEMNPVFVMVVLCLLVIGLPIGCYGVLGIGGFGPERSFTSTVQRTYVDTRSEESHYMVVTDAGVFEVDNGLLLGLWNADELYGKLLAGKSYRFTTEGNRVVNILFQEYPYITRAEAE